MGYKVSQPLDESPLIVFFLKGFLVTLKNRILCIEDHEDTRDVIFEILTREGHDVTCAGNPHEALNLVEASERFDLYIVDTWLPGMSGLDLSKRLRELDARIPILFFTAAASEVDMENAFQSGAQAYLVKPVDTERLAIKVARLISDSNKASC